LASTVCVKSAAFRRALSSSQNLFCRSVWIVFGTSKPESGIDVLGARGLVNGERIVPEGFGLQIDVRDFGFARAASVAQHYLAA
jgi:hypothetical protein